jgi:hypothetical protein
MKAQDKYLYDSAILGMNGIYQTIGYDSFYINVPSFILATDQVLTIGMEHIIFDTANEIGIKMIDVILVDAYNSEDTINLIVRDIRSQEEFTFTHCLECPEKECTNWILFDLDYLRDRMDAKAIKDYCHCDNDKKRTIGNSNPEVTEDLLEFEF